MLDEVFAWNHCGNIAFLNAYGKKDVPHGSVSNNAELDRSTRTYPYYE
ncbi:Hypothetical protein Cul05146_1520 [Corynebacterium ulcerans]|nr:Hypothetical protein Cul05146_1520 [Corynebacterium ulcerans]